MTAVVHAFLANSAIVNNTVNEVAMFGEISNYCRTFARDVQTYTRPEAANLEALVFYSRNNAGAIVLQNDQIKPLLDINDWIYNVSTAFPPNYSVNDFILAFTTAFSNYVTEVRADKLQSDGLRRMPGHISFKMIVANREDCIVHLWFSNASFEAGYDQTTIDVLPPVTAVDDLFKQFAAVQQLATKRTAIETFASIEQMKGKQPCTITVAVETTWTDPANASNRVPLIWYVNIYGASGNTSDKINTAIVDYIMGATKNDINSWKMVLPDLFRNTHFLVLPRWDRLAIPQRVGTTGLYSPTSSLREVRNFLIGKLTTYTPTQIDSFASVTVHPYRSISLGIVAGMDNRAGTKVFEDHVPDYIGQEAIGEDFYRQSQITQQWVTLMGNLLRVAENLALSAPAPMGMRLFNRDGIVYISQKLDNVEYMVALKANYGG